MRRELQLICCMVSPLYHQHWLEQDLYAILVCDVHLHNLKPSLILLAQLAQVFSIRRASAGCYDPVTWLVLWELTPVHNTNLLCFADESSLDTLSRDLCWLQRAAAHVCSGFPSNCRTYSRPRPLPPPTTSVVCCEAFASDEKARAIAFNAPYDWWGRSLSLLCEKDKACLHIVLRRSMSCLGFWALGEIKSRAQRPKALQNSTMSVSSVDQDDVI